MKAYKDWRKKSQVCEVTICYKEQESYTQDSACLIGKDKMTTLQLGT
jgi:hypothetical protein